MPELTVAEKEYLVKLAEALELRLESGELPESAQKEVLDEAALETGDRKSLLKAKVQDLTDPPGATKEEKKALAAIRLEFYGVLNRGGDPELYLKDLEAAFSKLQKEATKVKLAAAERKSLQESLGVGDVSEAGKYKATLKEKVSSLTDPEGATEEQKKSLAAIRLEFNTVLGRGGDPELHIDDLEAAFFRLHKEIKKVEGEIELVVKARSQLQSALDEAVGPKAAKAADVVPEATEEDVAPLLLERNRTAQALNTANTLPLLEPLGKPIEALKLAVGQVASKVEQRKEAARKILEAEPITAEVTGADEAAGDLKDLLATRQLVKDALKGTLSDKSLETAKALLENVAKDLVAAKQVVAKRKEEAESVLHTVESEPLKDDPPGAMKKQKERLNAARELVKKLLGESPLTANALAEGKKAKEGLEKLHQGVIAAVMKAGGAEAMGQLAAEVGDSGLESLEKEFGAEDPEKFVTLLKDLGGKDSVKKLLGKFPAAELKKVCDGLGGAQCVATLLADGCEGKPEQLESLYKAFGGDFTKLDGMLKSGGLAKHPKALAALVKTGCKGNPADFKTLCDNYTDPAALTNLADLLDKGGLGAKPECLGQMFAIGCADETEGAKGAAAKLQSMTKAIKDGNVFPKLQSLVGVKPNGEVDPQAEGGLGDNPEVFAHLIATGCGKDPQKFTALITSFDAPAAKNLNKLVKDGGFAKHQVEDPLGSGKKVDVVKPEALGKLLSIGCAGKPGDLKTVCQTLSASPNGLKGMKNLLQSGGLGAKPDCFGQMLAIGVKEDSGIGASASKFDAMLKTLDDPVLLPKMQGLLGVKANGVADPDLESGLGDNGEVFGHLVATGCEKNPAKVKTLLEKFDAGGLKNLNKLVKDGGFAKHEVEAPLGSGTKVDVVKPDCLAKFLTVGCAGDPEKLQKFGNTLTDEGRTGLQGMMQSGGFGVRPECLGRLVSTGFEDPDMAVSADKLNTLVKSMNTPEHQGKMRGLLGVKDDGQPDPALVGGLGDNDEVFGHLVGIGCGKDPTRLKSLLDGFDGPALTDFNKLVKDGGFASHKIVNGKPERKQVEYPPGSGTMVDAVHPKCLGRLLETGCDKDPAKLKGLCTALSNDERTRLQGCMEVGRVGEDPEVVGHLYGTGCDKTPGDMKAFCNAFDSTDKQKKLGNLMKKGGFNGKVGATKPATLGKVLKDAFKDGVTPHPENLIHLHDAFPGDTQLKKMERTFNAYNTPPTPGVLTDDPGKKLKRVMKALNVQNPGDFAKLRTTYYDRLATANVGNNKKPDGTNYNVTPPANEFLDALLANSGTLDLAPVPKHTPPPSGTEYLGNVRDYHFKNRHGRAHQDLNHHLTPHNPVSFWPEGVDQGEIMAQFNTARNTTTSSATLTLANGTVLNKANYEKVAATGGTPAVQFGAGDPVNGAFMDEVGVTYLKIHVVQNGRTLEIGIERTGAGVRYPQFYPISGPDVVKFNYNTINSKMKPALGQ